MGAANVTVSADSSVQARFTRIDDVNVEIRYGGPGLVARSVRVRYDCSLAGVAGPVPRSSAGVARKRLIV